MLSSANGWSFVSPCRRAAVTTGRLASGASDILDAPTQLTFGSLRMVPLCASAALAPVLPSPILLHGIWLAVASVVLSGRLPRLGAVDFLALGVALWASITTLWTVDAEASALAVRSYWGVGLLLIAIRHGVNSRRALFGLSAFFLAGCAYAAGQLIVDGRGLEPGIRRGVDGLNFNYTAYSLVTGVVVALMLLAFLPPLARRTRVALWLLNGLLTYAVSFTGTRGAMVALASMAIYLLVSRVSRAWAWGGAVVVVPLVLFCVPIGLYNGADLVWLEDFFDRSSGDLSGRLLFWPYALRSWFESPMTGIGVGAFPSTNPYYGVGAHSLVLTLGNDLGLVGLLLYGGTVVAALGAASSWRVPGGRPLCGLLLVGWLPIWLTGHWELAPVAWLVVALWSKLRVAFPTTAS
jgi:O-antigen ligase